MTDKTREAIKPTKTDLFHQRQREMSDAELLEKVWEQIGELAKTGGKSHRMCVPPSINDTDMLLSELHRRYTSLITAQADVVTDEQIEAEALSYASKPLAPYLRSEVFADGARWGISKLAQSNPDGWVSVKPEFTAPCRFLTATWDRYGYSINAWQILWIEFSDSMYLGLCDHDGEEWGDLADLKADWYMILPLPAPPKTDTNYSAQ